MWVLVCVRRFVILFSLLPPPSLFLFASFVWTVSFLGRAFVLVCGDCVVLSVCFGFGRFHLFPDGSFPFFPLFLVLLLTRMKMFWISLWIFKEKKLPMGPLLSALLCLESLCCRP